MKCRKMTRESFPEDGNKEEQIRWFHEKEGMTSAKAIAFCVGASPGYTRKVLNE